MHEITAEYFTPNMRLCQMPVRIFNGYVRAKKSENLEEEDGILETREFFRRVLSEETIKTGSAFRAEVSRAVGQIGFKVPLLGILVDTRGLESLKTLEMESREKADDIREQMLDDLAKAGESANLARCEVDLIALRLHPEEEFAEAVEKMISEALHDKYSEDSAMLTKTLTEALDSLSSGHALVAQKKLSLVGRFLANMLEAQGDSDQLAIARDELGKAKQIIGLRELAVDKKIIQLRDLTLFEGVKISASLQAGAAIAVGA